MTSVLNIFSNLGKSNKKNGTNDFINYKKSKVGSSTQTPSSLQAQKFKKYQNKIINSVEKNARKVSEGFENNTASQTKSVLKETDISSQKQTVANLKTQYDSTLNEYNTLVQQIQSKSTGYFDRVSPNNPYLNKTVRFTTGHIAYVTNKGVVKYVPSMEIWSSTGIPTNYIDLGIPWDDSYSTPGTTIATTPPLLSGTFLEMNQSVGNEGSNVFVDEYLSSSVTAAYQGCYADNTTSPLMTFIGDAPPPPTALVNGDFLQPSLANDTYEYLADNTTVPGWTFNNAILINNSSAWGYPTPYPFGSQAGCIQATGSFSQNLYLQSGVTYTLSFNACGRPGYSGANQINISADNLSDNIMPVQIYNFTPPLSWTAYSATFTVSDSKMYQLSFNGGIADPNNSTAIQNIQLGSSGAGSGGSYNYAQCKQSAINGGYQYFALQNVNTSNSQGYCAASNSQPTVTSLGESMTVTGQVALWASNTSGQPGNTATLTTTGSLSVLNSGGQSVFSTDNSKATPANYIGCYGDTGDRAMANTSNNQYLSFDDCKNLGAGYKYFATQAASNGMGWCAASNDLATATKYGQTSSCSKYGDNWMGSGWSNAIYSTEPDGSYFLQVQGDGNVCVNRGTSPSDVQGNIWCSGTNGKGQSPNPAFAAAKGKYGKDWIASGATLASGDFVGSADGTFALIMQSDGNLVLYTYTLGSNCQKMADGNTGAGPGGNALYGFNKTSIPGNMGKLAYVDENSKLYAYPSDNIKLVNTYSHFSDVDSGGHDIPGAAYGNSTIDQCETTCNSNSECAGFSFYQGVCYPKDNTMFPNGTVNMLKGCDTYIKNRQPKTPPTGVPSTTYDTDTVTYQNYLPGSGEISNQYGLSNATSIQTQQLNDLESTLNMITSEINKYTNLFENNGLQVDNQTNQNIKASNKYVKDISITNNQIKNFSTNMNRILDDSDIVVLQKNYDYLFWSILATGIVLISMNIVKK